MGKKKHEEDVPPVPLGAQAEGQAHNADVEAQDKKAKATKKTREVTKEVPSYPVESRINEYGFIHLPKAVLEDIGFPVTSKDNRLEVKLKVSKTSDGNGVIIERE